MNILNIHHVQITIPKDAEDSARHFYCDLLGLPEIEKPDSLKNRGGFWLQVGDRQVHVGTENDVDRRATKAHIAYHVDDVSEWHTHLTSNDISIGESIPIPSYHRFECRDPFGNRIEFIQTVTNP
jgi:catechol 2,3-dioxygenase-like lactoylglutathione lyase family enzyme